MNDDPVQPPDPWSDELDYYCHGERARPENRDAVNPWVVLACLVAIVLVWWWAWQ